MPGIQLVPGAKLFDQCGEVVRFYSKVSLAQRDRAPIRELYSQLGTIPFPVLMGICNNDILEQNPFLASIYQSIDARMRQDEKIIADL